MVEYIKENNMSDINFELIKKLKEHENKYIIFNCDVIDDVNMIPVPNLIGRPLVFSDVENIGVSVSAFRGEKFEDFEQYNFLKIKDIDLDKYFQKDSILSSIFSDVGYRTYITDKCVYVQNMDKNYNIFYPYNEKTDEELNKEFDKLRMFINQVFEK